MWDNGIHGCSLQREDPHQAIERKGEHMATRGSHSRSSHAADTSRNLRTTQVGTSSMSQWDVDGYSSGGHASENLGYAQEACDQPQVIRVRKRRKRRRKHVARKVLLVLLVVFVIVGGIAGFGGYKLYQSAQHVRSEATEAMNDIKEIKSDLASGKTVEAQQAAKNLTTTATAMKAETDGRLWVIAEKIPVYGEDFKTVRTLTRALKDVSSNALEPLCDQLSGISLKSLIGKDGTINVDQLAALANEMSAVAPVLQRNVDAFNARPKPHLSQVESVVSKTAVQLNEANDLFVLANRFAPLIPDVLGANGTRNYFIVAQNNVEVRATGGFFGSVGMATVDNGKITMGDFAKPHGSVYDNAYVEEGIGNSYEHVGIVEYPAENLYNLGTNPDVPSVAKPIRDACGAADAPVDGVVFVDPVFVQYIVGLTGGFEASDGTWVDGSNAATVLMHDTYWKFVNDGESQDAFFTMIADDAMKHVFGSLGNVEMKQLAEVIQEGASKRHFSVWFSDEDEESAVYDLGCSGAVSTDPEKAVAGIYFNNNSWSKLEWYLRAATDVVSETKNSDGSTTYEVKLELSNAITDEEAQSGNTYVVAGNGAGNKVMYEPGDMLEYVYLMAPAGGSISDVSTDADVYNEAVGTLCGNDLIRKDVHLLPGQTVTFTYKVTTSPQAKGALEFDMTPLAQDALQ